LHIAPLTAKFNPETKKKQIGFSMTDATPSAPASAPVPEIPGELAARRIIHIDMDAFFASIEQREHPEWRGKPVIVGGSPERRGVVSTASYEARKFGIHSAMPAKTAHRLCPNGIFVPGDIALYRAVSHQIREIFARFTDLVEPLSIDEAFLDVTHNRRGEPSATRLAMELQRTIFAETGLTASAGVSFNKFLAKVASDYRKPAGLTVITPRRFRVFLDALPIEKFYGVGEVSAKTFRRLGVANGAELLQTPLEVLLDTFGKIGRFYYDIVRGIDPRPVDPSENRQSMGREITLPRDIDDPIGLHDLLRHLAVKVSAMLEKKHLAGRTVTLKVRYEDFTTVTRSMTHAAPVAAADALEQTGALLLKRTEAGLRKVRLLGLSVSGFPHEDPGKAVQLELPLEWRDGE